MHRCTHTRIYCGDGTARNWTNCATTRVTMAKTNHSALNGVMSRTRRIQTSRKARCSKRRKRTENAPRKQLVKKTARKNVAKKRRTANLSEKAVSNTNPTLNDRIREAGWKLIAMAHNVYTFVKRPTVQCVLRCVLLYITSNENSERCT